MKHFCINLCAIDISRSIVILMWLNELWTALSHLTIEHEQNCVSVCVSDSFLRYWHLSWLCYRYECLALDKKRQELLLAERKIHVEDDQLGEFLFKVE